MRVRKNGRRAGAVQLKIRFGDFQTITRSQTLPTPTDSTADLWHAAQSILEKWAASSFSPVRLIGVQATSLTGEETQLALFRDPEAERRKQLDTAVDAINQKLGSDTVFRGGRKR